MVLAALVARAWSAVTAGPVEIVDGCSASVAMAGMVELATAAVLALKAETAAMAVLVGPADCWVPPVWVALAELVVLEGPL